MTEETLEARQMAALSEWLEQDTLTTHEAACLLAGVLPPERAADERVFGAWLPGCKAWEHGREAWAFGVKAKIAYIETVLREDESRHDQSPKAYLALGAKRGFLPPWLDPARAYPACRKYLPKLGRLRTNRSNSSYSALHKKWPDWHERVEYAFSLYSQGLSVKAAKERFAERYSDGPEIDGWLREFRIKGVTAEAKTRDFRAYLQERG